MIVIAYLRDGRVYSDADAWRAGLAHGPYRLTPMPPVAGQRPPATSQVAHTTLLGVDYISLWCFPVDAKFSHGAVPFARANDPAVAALVGATTGPTSAKLTTAESEAASARTRHRF